MVVLTLAVGKRRDGSILSWVATRERGRNCRTGGEWFVQANGRILHVYTVYCADSTSNQATDPCRATITGMCADIPKSKGRCLRGLAGRPPYFHNGAAPTVDDVVEF